MFVLNELENQWKLLCKEIAEVLISKEKQLIIDAKVTNYAIREKDINDCFQYADKVIFWCLYDDGKNRLDDEQFEFVSSDELILQLEKHEAYLLVSKIRALKNNKK